MAITVKNVLELPSLKEFRLAAGKKGLDHIVEKAGIVDYEFADGAVPSSADAFEQNSFVIGTLLFAKDRPEWILQALQTLRSYGVSALAVKTVFFRQLPPEVLRYADETGFPLFLFDHSYFEDVIAELREALKGDQTAQREHRLLDELIGKRHSSEEVRRLALELHAHLRQWNRAFFCVGDREYDDWEAARILNFFALNAERSQETAAFVYEDGFLFLVSDVEKAEERFQIGFENGIRTAGLAEKGETLTVGRGKVYGLEELDRGVREAITACRGALLLGKKDMDYAEMGFLRILMEADQSALRSCAEDFLSPLRGDGETGAMLWKTAEAYVRAKGDIGSTSEALFLHPNTVRYRLGKIREKLDKGEGEYLFFQNLSTAVWARRIIESERARRRNDR